MLEARGRVQLALEARPRAVEAQLLGADQLECDRLAVGAAGQEHDAHAARAEPTLEAKAPQLIGEVLELARGAREQARGAQGLEAGAQVFSALRMAGCELFEGRVGWRPLLEALEVGEDQLVELVVLRAVGHG
jgi:hypothetical protein